MRLLALMRTMILSEDDVDEDDDGASDYDGVNDCKFCFHQFAHGCEETGAASGL